MLWPFSLTDALARFAPSRTTAEPAGPLQASTAQPRVLLPPPLATGRSGGVWRAAIRDAVVHLLELSRLLMSELALELVYGTVLRVVQEAVGATRISLQVLEDAGDTLILVAAQGLPPQAHVGQATPRDQGLAGWVLARQQPLLVVGATHPDPAVRQLLRQDQANGAATSRQAPFAQSALCVPLVADGQPLGVLSASTFDPAHPFTADDLDFLSLLAGQVALAVANARLHERVAHLASRDPLTGLLNHRTFHEQLDAEVERAARSRTELALLLLDLDGFKAVNDTYGHPAGDRLLQLVAGEAVESSIRPYDTAARLGGDEFAVLLPQSTLANAQRIGERIRQAVQDLDYVAHGLPRGLVTSSIGLAHFPADARGGAALREVADRGLYRAKYLGRNRLERATSPACTGAMLRG